MVFSLRSTSSGVRSAISTVFCRLVSPRTMLMLRRGTERRSANRLSRAALAAPSTGGAVRRALSVPCSHASTFLLLRGMTRTAINIWLPAQGKSLQQKLLENHEQEPGHDKREIDYTHRSHNTAHRRDERIGDAGEEANKGVALIEAKPRRDRPHQHCQDKHPNAILHKEADDGNRRYKQRHSSYSCTVRTSTKVMPRNLRRAISVTRTPSSSGSVVKWRWTYSPSGRAAAQPAKEEAAAVATRVRTLPDAMPSIVPSVIIVMPTARLVPQLGWMASSASPACRRVRASSREMRSSPRSTSPKIIKPSELERALTLRSGRRPLRIVMVACSRA